MSDSRPPTGTGDVPGAKPGSGGPIGRPAAAAAPTDPTAPTAPTDPTAPTAPTDPTAATAPTDPTAATDPAGAAGGLARTPAILLLPALLGVMAALDLAGFALDLAPSGAGALAAVADGGAAALAVAVAAAVVRSVRRPPTRIEPVVTVTVLSVLAAAAVALSASAGAVRSVRAGDPVHLAGLVVAVLAAVAVPVPWLAVSAVVAVQVPFAAAVALHSGSAVARSVFLVALDAAVLAAAVLHRHRIDALRGEADTVRVEAARQAVLDPLTGAGNRRGLDILALPMIENARRKGEAVHCLYLDLDGFRRVNEDLGRVEGDALLVAAYEAVNASVRTTDVVARLDADRFVVLGPGTGTSPLEMERRVRAQLEDHPPVSADVWEPGVSIGSATLVPWDEGGVDVLLRRAEEDMRLRRSLRRQSRLRSRGAQPPVPPGLPGIATER